jgi:hypothetical protein
VPSCRAGFLTRAYLLDPVARVGTVIDVTAGTPAPTAKLLPCGAIRLRVLDSTGSPKAGQEVTNTPFATTGNRDVEAYAILLNRMATDGFAPCAVSQLADYTLFTRTEGAKRDKPDFRIVLLADVLVSKGAPAERWARSEFVEVLNKLGEEEWDWCVGNCNAVVLRKSPVKREFQIVQVTKNPLSRNSDQWDKDDGAEAFRLILEGLEASGWKPCGIDYLNQQFLVKRRIEPDAKDKR